MNPGILLALLGGLTLITAQVGVLQGWEPFASWFYTFTWWPYILFVDGVVRLRTGSSMLTSRPRSFLLLMPWSCAFWLLFEGANLFLENWYYIGLPHQTAIRLGGSALAFATVLPGILETDDLLRSFGIFRSRPCRTVRATHAGIRLAETIGIACLVLPFVAPRYAFPLIWIGVSLLLEPWLYIKGRRGLLRDLTRGESAGIFRALSAGLLCGLLWEYWNSFALAKWIYTVPFFEEGKLFEMPYLGFLGFPPFAVECVAFAGFLVGLGWIPDWREPLEEGTALPPPKRPAGLRWSAAIAALLVTLPILSAMDAKTIRATAPRFVDLTGVSEELAKELDETFGSLDALIEVSENGVPEKMPEGCGETELLAWRAESELMRVRGLASRGMTWLRGARITDRASLAAADPDELFASLKEGPAPRPTAAEVRVWVRGARRAERK